LSAFDLHDRPPDHFRDLRDEAISERPQSVHPIGYPSNHSTHEGFRLLVIGCGISLPNRTISFKSRELGGKVSAETGAPFQSRAEGVGQISRLTARSNVKACRPFSRHAGLVDFIRMERPSLSATVGVGHDPDSVPPVRGTNGASRYAFVAIYINSDNLRVIA
jgi:hypothetical protein